MIIIVLYSVKSLKLIKFKYLNIKVPVKKNIKFAFIWSSNSLITEKKIFMILSFAVYPSNLQYFSNSSTKNQ